MAFKYQTALVIGGSRGTGRAIAKKLSETGTPTYTIARNQADLDSLKASVPVIEILALDAANDGVAEKLLTELSPDLIVLAGGHIPQMDTISELTWKDFSATWNADTKIAFEFTKAALLAPMSKGGAMVSFASGAAISGSPLSGGYAGAKRMQHYVSNYGQWEADRRDLELKFYTVYPKQFIAETDIANSASEAYATANRVSQEQIMKQWEKPLTPTLISTYVFDLLNAGATPGTYGVTGTGMETMD